ncbi:MAG TPA: hypothetical protein VF669_19260 [Tepidisphaeraceae bacterium]|jgi:hypothetical protein
MNDPRQSGSGMTPTPQRPMMNNPQQARPMLTPRPVVMPRPAAAPVPVQPAAPRPQAQPEAPIALVEDIEAIEEASPPPTSKIVFGPDVHHRKHDWKRAPSATGNGACRVKTFHGKLSEQGMEFLDDAINTWLDTHPEFEVKFVTSTVGLFDGKMKDQALILNVWY